MKFLISRGFSNRPACRSALTALVTVAVCSRRQRDQQREDLRQHQQVKRRDAERAHGVDFLGHGHRADLRGIGGTRAPGDDEGGDQGRELAQHGQADEIVDERSQILPRRGGEILGVAPTLASGNGGERKGLELDREVEALLATLKNQHFLCRACDAIKPHPLGNLFTKLGDAV